MNRVKMYGRALAVLWVALTIPGMAQADGDKRAAKRHTERAAILYDLGRFEQARVFYERAYELYPEPALLFNVGQCHRRSGDHARAAHFFERYLSERPHADNRALAEALLQESRRYARQTPRAPAPRLAGLRDLDRPPPKAPVDARRPAIYERWWFWTAVGGAAVLAGGGMYMALDDDTPSGSLGAIDGR